jgi:hypothetical protein
MVLAVVLAAWFGLTASGAVSPHILPRPGDVAQAFGQIVRAGPLLRVAVLSTLSEVVLAFAIAAVVGVSLGVVIGREAAAEMIQSIPDLIASISSVCPLLPGDIIFTGTPAGVGHRRTPPRYLQPGDELLSSIEGIGTLKTRFI